MVELRFFGGLSVEETAAALEVSPRTVQTDWAFARAWLYRALAAEQCPVTAGAGSKDCSSRLPHVRPNAARRSSPPPAATIRPSLTSCVALGAAEQSGSFLTVPALERFAREISRDGWSVSPGERVGVYIVGRRIGAGGMGEVWRARDERLGASCARSSSCRTRLRRLHA